MSPTIDSSSSHLLIEVDISPSETQVFLVDASLNILFVENSFWVDSQLRIVHAVIDLALSGNIHVGQLKDKNILLGVWHFGHFIGDHIHHLISSEYEQVRNSTRSLHISSGHLFIKELSRLFMSQSNLQLNDDIVLDHKLASARIYSLIGCKCIFPSMDKSVPLSIAQTYLSKKAFLNRLSAESTKILLVSGRKSRIGNINEIVKISVDNGWLVLNPLVTPLALALNLIYHADRLISENGSILFNCFISRTKPYDVLASARSVFLNERDMIGGGVYNEFHNSLITYRYFEPTTESHHPYSDQISIPPDLFKSILVEP